MPMAGSVAAVDDEEAMRSGLSPLAIENVSGR